MIVEGWQYTNTKKIDSIDWQAPATVVGDYVDANDFDVCIVDGILAANRINAVAESTRVVVEISSNPAQPLTLHHVISSALQQVELTSTLEIHVHVDVKACLHMSFDIDAEVMALWRRHVRIVLDQGAHLRVLWQQQTEAQLCQFAQVTIEQQASSDYQSLTLASHTQINRTDTQVLLQGEHASAQLFGYFEPKNNEQSNHYIVAHHQAKNCRSEQYYKGIIDDSAVGVFSSKVIVAEGADGSDSLQTNKNILLSPQAQVNTLPVLEVYADDVTASHGATVGDLDDDAYFYLRSRGIDANDAKALLLNAFAIDILSMESCYD